MKVIYKKTIIEKIDAEIFESNMNKKYIENIFLEKDEMEQFVNETHLYQSVLLHYPSLGIKTFRYRGIFVSEEP